MRHDPAGAAIVIMLRSLKLPGMAVAVNDLLEQGAPAFDAAVPILSQLLKAEMAEREVRSIAYHMKAARFPAYKDLSGFTFADSETNEALARENRMSRRPSAFKPLNIIASACVSSRRLSWSMRWNKKRFRAKLEKSLRR